MRNNINPLIATNQPPKYLSYGHEQVIKWKEFSGQGNLPNKCQKRVTTF